MILCLKSCTFSEHRPFISMFQIYTTKEFVFSVSHHQDTCALLDITDFSLFTVKYHLDNLAVVRLWYWRDFMMLLMLSGKEQLKFLLSLPLPVSGFVCIWACFSSLVLCSELKKRSLSPILFSCPFSLIGVCLYCSGEYLFLGQEGYDEISWILGLKILVSLCQLTYV